MYGAEKNDGVDGWVRPRRKVSRSALRNNSANIIAGNNGRGSYVWIPSIAVFERTIIHRAVVRIRRRRVTGMLHSGMVN